jgi:hypothetical protein
MLEDLDDNERAILDLIFQVQLVEQRGITWGELLEREPIKKMMSRQTFSHRLKGLLESGTLEKEVIKNKKGKPTLYRLNSKLFSTLHEFRSRYYPWDVEKKIQEFEKEISSYDTEHYIDAMLELAFGRLNLLAIALTFFDQEGARLIFYEENYKIIERILWNVLNRAGRSKVDKEQTLLKLFELLEPFSKRPIGKRFDLNEVYNSKQGLIDKILEA